MNVLVDRGIANIIDTIRSLTSVQRNSWLDVQVGSEVVERGT